MIPERRTQHLRRDINDLVRGPDGKVSEAKVYVVAFKGVLLYVFVHRATEILADWTLLMVFVGTFIFPDILKKLISVKAGVK